MTELVAHGIEVALPSGWEGRVFRRPAAGEAAAADANVEGEPAAAAETTHAIVHVATVALSPEVGDFGSGAVDQLRDRDIFIALFEYDPASIEQPLFRTRGMPRELTPDDFSPSAMQRAIRGQCGAQRFFNEQGRAFCLYVVLGSFARRREAVPRVNEVLATLTIESSTPAIDSTGTTGSSTTTTTTTTGSATDGPDASPAAPTTTTATNPSDAP